jgi:ATP-dependent DNA helicase RecG
VAKHKTNNYRIRFRSNSIVPNDEQTTELIQLTAKIPFDDRVNTFASVQDLSKSLMRSHLEETKSKLFTESENMTVEELAEKMNLCQGAKEHLFPKNIGLLMFSKNTQKHFKGAVIDLVEFPEGLVGKTFNEKTFTGTIQEQLKDVLSYIRTNIIKEKVVKYSDREKADRFVNYPYDALEEALANAVYHRNYELLDPIEVRILPTAIEIISYNGVDPSLKQSDFDKGIVRARRYRNRRIGEFLKELRLTEGKGTGIPTIIMALSDNGSPTPIFDANEPERTFFISEIRKHEAFNGPSEDQVKKLLESLDIRTLSQVEELANQLGPYEWDQVMDQVMDQAEQINKHLIPILEYCRAPKSRKEICEVIGLTNKDTNFKRYAGEPLEFGWIAMIGNPNSKDQKYITTEKGINLIK